jgi:hypothetical protein
MKMLLLFTFLLATCSAGTETANVKSQAVKKPLAKKLAPARMIFTSHTVKLADHTFGYIINRNDVVFIKQNSVPGKSGKRGFVREADARRVSELIITKLVKGEFPPLVSDQEIDKIINSKQ